MELLQNPALCILFALIIAGIIVFIMSRFSRTHVTVNGKTYMKNHRLNVKNKMDRFTHKTSSRRRVSSGSGAGAGGRPGGRPGGPHPGHR